MKKRRSLTHKEAIETLDTWLWKKRMRQATFVRWLAERGITISAPYLHEMMIGKRPPGPKFKAIFKEITGVTLVDGLIEAESRTRGE